MGFKYLIKVSDLTFADLTLAYFIYGFAGLLGFICGGYQ